MLGILFKAITIQIKTTIKAIALGLSLTIPSVHAGFPVSVLVDVPGQLAQFQNMAQMLKEYATMLDPLNKIQEQLQQMEREYNSVTGTRGLGNILNNPNFSKHLPDNWQTILRNIRYNGYEGLDGAAKALRDASKVIDSCEYIEDRVERQNCAALALKPVQDQAEQALIQNEQTKLSMYQATSESEQRLLLQQQKEINSRTWRSKNYGADVPPMEF